MHAIPCSPQNLKTAERSLPIFDNIFETSRVPMEHIHLSGPQLVRTSLSAHPAKVVVSQTPGYPFPDLARVPEGARWEPGGRGGGQGYQALKKEPPQVGVRTSARLRPQRPRLPYYFWHGRGWGGQPARLRGCPGLAGRSRRCLPTQLPMAVAPGCDSEESTRLSPAPGFLAPHGAGSPTRRPPDEQANFLRRGPSFFAFLQMSGGGCFGVWREAPTRVGSVQVRSSLGRPSHSELSSRGSLPLLLLLLGGGGGGSWSRSPAETWDLSRGGSPGPGETLGAPPSPGEHVTRSQAHPLHAALLLPVPGRGSSVTLTRKNSAGGGNRRAGIVGAAEGVEATGLKFHPTPLQASPAQAFVVLLVALWSGKGRLCIPEDTRAIRRHQGFLQGLAWRRHSKSVSLHQVKPSFKKRQYA